MEIKQTKLSLKTQHLSIAILMFGIIFVASNLRAPLTSVGPLVSMIRDDLSLSNTLAGLITTLPLLTFAIFSPIVPKLSEKVGSENIILIAMIFLSAGMILRSQIGILPLYIGTAIIGLSIAVANVLLPSLIKQKFPHKVGLMTGVYSISMNLTGAIASGVSIPIAIHIGFGWHGALGVWGILSMIAIFIWLPQILHQGKKDISITKKETEPIGNPPKSVWKSPLAWKVTLFMGLQSLIFYVLVAWLPEILSEKGINADESGFLLFMLQMALLPVTFIIPIIAGKMNSQRLLVGITIIMYVIGILGLLYGNEKQTLLWIIFLGIGIGFAFSLAMMFFPLRTNHAREAAELSGMAQSIGYLLAAIGPTLFGFLYDITNNWNIPLYTLLGVAMIIFIVGLGAAKDQTI